MLETKVSAVVAVVEAMLETRVRTAVAVVDVVQVASVFEVAAAGELRLLLHRDELRRSPRRNEPPFTC